MGSLETGIPLKRDHHLLRSSFSQRTRSRFTRFVLFKKIDYLQWICTVAVFFFFVVVFQMSLPGSVVEKSVGNLKESEEGYKDLTFVKEFGGFDFGEDLKFEPSKILAKFGKEEVKINGSRSVTRFDDRKPKLALVFADLLVDSHQIKMATVAAALREIGYEIEVFSHEDGPLHAIWNNMGLPVHIMETSENMKINVDWLNYDGIFLNSLDAVGVFPCLVQEPFKNVPIIWSIHEQILGTRLRQYISSGKDELINNWRKIFSRATVVVFPNYILPMLYSVCDAGNYFVIPGSPTEAWEADSYLALNKANERGLPVYGPNDFVIAIVGSQALYKGLWLEHALVLQALFPILQKSPNDGNLEYRYKFIVLAGDSTSNYSMALETITLSLGYPKDTVKHVMVDEDVDSVLSVADVVVYSSFREEEAFPGILLKAMCFEKPVIAPDLSVVRKYVDDRVNGFLFPKENIKMLTQIMMQVISKGKLSLLAQNAASIGKRVAKNLMVSESVEGYALLLEKILKLPSEVANSQPVTKIPAKLKAEWHWHIFEQFKARATYNKTGRTCERLERVEKLWNHTHKENYVADTETNGTFIYSIWEEEKYNEIARKRKRREDEELKDRTEQPRGTWEEVYRNAKRADRSRNDLHERDDGELERTGQPLCIYEPYFGEGTWSFLHNTSLYRGLGLSTKGRRPATDDIDATSRLPLLNNPYYRDILGEYGGFFAIANRIDRIHKNGWIGFQSWRATGRKESLSKTAERSLLDAVESRRQGDTFYFWARMDTDPRNPQRKDFWSFCDALNAGNCQFAFSEALNKMYGIKHNISSLPPMPSDGDTWSVMHSWVLPTRSFLEFVMFSRMFVDALDSLFYDDHHQSGYCYLSLTKDKHCYSRILELLVNVWAYHSPRRMVYVNPKTGLMQEQHSLKSRKGQMWVKWFQFSTIKNMDEDLAEESDSDHPKRHWLWPSTGEVFWQGIYEKEKNMRNREKEKRKQQSKDKISRIRKRARQKTLGKYVKPPPEEMENSNSTTEAAKLLR